MPLLKNEKHERYHSLGPKDCRWPKWGARKKVVAQISATRSTIDNEQLTIGIPVFEDDSRRDLDDRLGMLLSIVQDRMDDANSAWLILDEEAKAAAEAEKGHKGR